MSSVVVIVFGVWFGCLIAEALDGFRSTKQLVRELARQWTWVKARVKS